MTIFYFRLVSALMGACPEMGESEPGSRYVLASFCYLTFQQAEMVSFIIPFIQLLYMNSYNFKINKRFNFPRIKINFKLGIQSILHTVY